VTAFFTHRENLRGTTTTYAPQYGSTPCRVMTGVRKP
jgi:hypothetical protein